MRRFNLDLIIFFFTVFGAYAQWTDKGEYKEMQAANAQILQVAAGQNYFTIFTQITYPYNFKVFRYDFAGNLIFARDYNLQQYFVFMKMSSDGETILTDGGPLSSGEWIDTIFVHDIINDSLIIKKDFKVGYTNGEGQLPEVPYYRNADYNSNQNQLLYQSKVYYDGGSQIYGYIYREYCDNSIYKESIDSNYQYSNYLVGNFATSINFDYLVCSESLDNHQTDQYDNYTSGSKTSNFSFINLINNKKIIISGSYQDYIHSNKSSTGLIPDYFRFAKNDSFFIAISGNTIYRYKYTADTVMPMDTFNLSKSFYDVVISPDSKYLIVANKSPNIDLVYIPTKSVVKTYNFLDNKPAGMLTLTPDDRGFICQSETGIIKYFEPDWGILDIPIENTNNFDVRLYPNPASDNIRFEINNSEGHNTILNIYDNFGRLVNQINNAVNSINLDLTNYSSGIYFYRLQCGQNLKTGKFSVIK